MLSFYPHDRDRSESSQNGPRAPGLLGCFPGWLRIIPRGAHGGGSQTKGTGAKDEPKKLADTTGDSTKDQHPPLG